MGLGGHHPATSPLQFFYPGTDPLGQPPPAHMGIPPYQLDPKTVGAIGKQKSCSASPFRTTNYRKLMTQNKRNVTLEPYESGRIAGIISLK